MTPEARAARERKQKIFVVVGGLFLLALLAIQLPKLLGGSSAPAAAATTTSEAATPSTPAAPSGAVPVAAAPRVVETGKLSSFGAFVAKDPFVQQVVTETPVGTTAGGAAASGKKSAKTPEKTFSTGKSVASAVTIVTVNGERQVLQPGMKFPSSDPLFVLVAERPDSKSVVVGIVGGAYSGGATTTTLKVGKALTLVNSATGARYKISLVSVGSGDSSEQPAQEP